MKILICDDEEGVRESLKLILADNYDLILCDNHNQCLDCLKNNADIKLLFLDIKMPDIDGLKTLKYIQENYAELKTVIITGYSSVDTAAEAVKLGALAYIVKPFKTEEILNIAKEQLN